MTRERIQEIIARIEMFGHGAGYTVDEVYELARMALATLDSEPVAWIVHARTGDQLTTDGGYVANAEGILGLHSTPLYRHAQQPVVTFYRDGIEAAAKWIDKQREAYDSEHGWSDPDTGAFEFGNDAQRGYSSTLEELAEGIRALHPNAGNSPAIPEGYVMVPMEPTEAMCFAPDVRVGNKTWDGYQSSADMAECKAIYEAMLAAAPTGIPMNSNGWIPVSERMPESNGVYFGWDGKRVLEVNCFFGGWSANQFIHGEITHWMPLPAAPKEVNGE